MIRNFNLYYRTCSNSRCTGFLRDRRLLKVAWYKYSAGAGHGIRDGNRPCPEVEGEWRGGAPRPLRSLGEQCRGVIVAGRRSWGFTRQFSIEGRSKTHPFMVTLTKFWWNRLTCAAPQVRYRTALARKSKADRSPSTAQPKECQQYISRYYAFDRKQRKKVNSWNQ